MMPMHSHNRPSYGRVIGRVSFLLLPLAMGCFGGEYTPIRHYGIVPTVSVEAMEQTSLSLGLHNLDYARYYKQEMVYRENSYTIAYSEYDQWAELPRDTITRALLDALIQTNRFTDVGYAYDLSRPSLILTGELRKLDQNRATTPWTAECEIRLELRDPLGEKVLWAGTLSAAQPLETQDGQGFAIAASKALSTIIQQATERIAAHAE